MTILITLLALLFAAWFTHGLIEYLRDLRWRRVSRHTLQSDPWRQVPPPNWASRRGTQDYW